MQLVTANKQLRDDRHTDRYTQQQKKQQQHCYNWDQHPRRPSIKRSIKPKLAEERSLNKKCDFENCLVVSILKIANK